MKPIRVLVVDDSPTMRGVITAALRRDPEIEVIGGAGDPYEAREAIKALSPDVITLDVEMPRMGGIEFLERIMRLRPMPVIMVSTLTQAGAATTLEALELGAFDCVGKPDFDGLVDKVKAAAHSRVRGREDRPAPGSRPATFEPADRILAIGSSTGGVEALISILQCFPENCPPTLITQHMPATFTKSFAARLDRMCAAQVEEAEDGAPVKAGRVYLAPGAAHLEVVTAKDPVCRLRQSEPVSGHRPSVDVLFESVARSFGSKAVGVILTGMGKDGAKGLLAMREAGARTLGQDEGSSVVYGMPKVAFELGAVEKQLPLYRIAAAALDLCSISNARGVR
jgi:two-component system, chemotaxis family, protein-glutamate methylesterase/glutaminase